MNYLDYPEASLKEMGAYWTAKEIHQQPTSWANTLSMLSQKDSEIASFLKPILGQQNLRIILTGAGTSAFIGNSLAPALSANLGFQVEAIANTDLVSNPYDFFHEQAPTLLVSFARSGNSPESIAAIDYAEKIVKNCYQLAVTCNPDGALFQRCQNSKRLALLMPEETDDKSLAMTSSFSSMMLSALYIFSGVEHFGQKLNATVAATESTISKYGPVLKSIAEKKHERVIYLGSGVFKGLAQESALKLLELTDGQAISSHDSPLGFRHGPKAIVNEDTLVVVFISNNPHTRKYDLALVRELKEDARVGEVVVITALENLELGETKTLVLEGLDTIEDIFLLLPFIVCAQIYAFQHAVCLGNSPDNPSSSGTINRVVQGVSIYAL